MTKAKTSPRRGTWMLILVLLIGPLASCGSSGPSALDAVWGSGGGQFIAPPSLDCRVSAAQPVTVIPMGIFRHGREVVPYVNVCVGTVGPFLFDVDTAAPTTSVNQSLVDKLHLKEVIPTGRRPT